MDEPEACREQSGFSSSTLVVHDRASTACAERAQSGAGVCWDCRDGWNSAVGVKGREQGPCQPRGPLQLSSQPKPSLPSAAFPPKTTSPPPRPPTPPHGRQQTPRCVAHAVHALSHACKVHSVSTIALQHSAHRQDIDSTALARMGKAGLSAGALGKICFRPWLVANQATLPQKWPSPSRNVAGSCQARAGGADLSPGWGTQGGGSGEKQSPVTGA